MDQITFMGIQFKIYAFSTHRMDLCENWTILRNDRVYSKPGSFFFFEFDLIGSNRMSVFELNEKKKYSHANNKIWTLLRVKLLQFTHTWINSTLIMQFYRFYPFLAVSACPHRCLHPKETITNTLFSFIKSKHLVNYVNLSTKSNLKSTNENHEKMKSSSYVTLKQQQKIN